MNVVARSTLNFFLLKEMILHCSIPMRLVLKRWMIVSVNQRASARWALYSSCSLLLLLQSSVRSWALEQRRKSS